MVDRFTDFYNHGRNSCLIPIFSMTFADELFQAQVRQGLEQWISSVQQVLQDAGFSPAIARQRAEDTVIRIQGALVVARALQQTQPFDRVVKQLPHDLLGLA
jgi:hypothetical protein